MLQSFLVPIFLAFNIYMIPQCFSILANDFKSQDVFSVQELKAIIEAAPIKPRAIAKDLDYTFDWKKYVTPNLSDPELRNHSKYNSFQFKLGRHSALLRLV